LTGEGEPERLTGAIASSNLFAVLAVDPALGRTFSDADVREGNRVAVIGHGLWVRRFGADAGISGRSIALNDVATTIIGVMPPGFELGEAEVWIPVELPGSLARGNFFLQTVGRLRDGVTLEQASADLDRIGTELAGDFPGEDTAGGLALSLREARYGNIRRPLALMLGVVALVLLMACANVANLMLARGLSRARELAVRSALGASRTQLVRQLVVESAFLAAAGGVAATLLVMWTVPTLVALDPDALAGIDHVPLDARVMTFTTLAVLLATLLFGATPALLSTRRDAADLLRDAARGTTAGVRGRRFSAGLIGAQVALAVIPLAGAGLLLRSFEQLVRVDTGLATEGALTMTMQLPASRYREDADVASFYGRLLKNVAVLPGVTAAGAVSHAPLTGNDAAGSLHFEDRPEPSPAETPWSRMRAASPRYFDAAGISLLRGRAFTDADTENAPHVAIVDEAFARAYFPDGDAIGKQFRLDFEPDVPREIVGIVRSVRHEGVAIEPEPQLYVPFTQQALHFMTLVVRTDGDPIALDGPVREQVRALDPNLPVYGVNTLAGLVSRSLAGQRFSAVLVAIFGLLALVMAAAGIYGVVSFTVSQRTREIGIRVALGAERARVLRMLLLDEGRWALAGGIIGLLGALALQNAIRNMLYGVSGTDLVTYMAVAALLGAVALLATWIPARRAASTDPVATLRME
jgi:putative ABC transport system permease protein